MTQAQIDRQVEVIQSVTADLLKQGPEACRQFLIDAGIIPGDPSPSPVAGEGQRKAEDGWIRVDADVPKETYLLLFNGNWTGVGKCQMVDDYNDEDGPLVPRWEDETSEFISPSPTHYMPLPLPPKD